MMQEPDWPSTAICLTWYTWGGFYDHVAPPVADQNGCGLRLPELVICTHARKGYIDRETLSFDAYLMLIHDLFLGGQQPDPNTDGRPDVRERAGQLGDLLQSIDFSQPAWPQSMLPENPLPGPASVPCRASVMLGNQQWA